MVKAHTISLAYVQGRTNEAGSPEGELHRGCQEDAEWSEALIAAGINFSSTTALRFADLEGLPSNNTMGPVNARPLQDVSLNHDERN